MRRGGWSRWAAVSLAAGLMLALGACEAGGSGACETSADCADGQLCVSGTCRAPGGSGTGGCQSDGDCGSGEQCAGGRCVAWTEDCDADADCTAQAGGVCEGGTCSYPAPVGCQSDADCPGAVCNRATGDCEPAAEDCAGGCDDGDPCTEDACVAAACAHAPIAGCCAVDGECDDGVDATVDRCVDGGCEHQAPCTGAVECEDGDPCTLDRCTDDGCRHERVIGCCAGPGDCDDDDPCTADVCVGGACQFTVAPGCCTADADCEDGNPCTTNTCAAGECATAPVAGCCTAAGDCDDGNVCTQDACEAGGNCRNTRVTGCCRADADCNDGVACTADTCRADHTCTNAWIADCCATAADCDDDDTCTTDACGEDARCAHTPLPGCCRSAADCDDGDPCTTDRCNANVCESVPVAECCAGDGECDDGNPCTEDRCTANACRHTTFDGCCETDADCDDGVAATVDTCDGSRVCHHDPREGCGAAAECDDADPCTEDRCENGACAWYLVLDEVCRCTVEADCGADEVCSLLELEDGGLWGYCFLSEGGLPMGAPCDPDSPTALCESGICVELMGTDVCFGACASDADCAGGATCDALPLPSGGTAPDHEMDVCVPPLLACADDAGCPADMYCAAVTLADAPAELVLACLYADETLLRTGQPCTADAQCLSDFCLTDEAQGGICWGLCDGDDDCQAGQRCYDPAVTFTLTLGTPATSDDVEVELPGCTWDMGSFDPCTRESDCAAAEVCFPALNDARTAFAPLCLLPDTAATVAPGARCTSGSECQTTVCVGGYDSDRCLQFCGASAECSGGAVCETVPFQATDEDGNVVEIDGDVCVD